jgi:hypothetical protein
MFLTLSLQVAKDLQDAMQEAVSDAKLSKGQKKKKRAKASKLVVEEQGMPLQEIVHAPLSAAAAAPPVVGSSSLAPINPICRVSEVRPASPAAAAGLRVGDLILEFGSLDRANFVDIVNSVVPELTRNKGSPVRVLVERAGQRVPLSLTPNEWGGGGLLGCVLVKL